jgi:DNA repair protein RadC
MAPHIFQSETDLQNIAEAAPLSRRFSVSERLARFSSSPLSGVEHLRLLVGKVSIADALLRHFGSLKALSRASLKELFTKRVAAAAQILQIHFLDHVIVGQAMAGTQGFFSFQEAGLL